MQDGMPRKQESETFAGPDARQHAASQRADKPQRPYNGRVLLADDCEGTRELLRILLEKMGIEVDIAETGNEACQKAATSAAERRPYDLIFMDMEMPEIDGYQATRRLRNLAWQGPVIAVTAHTGPGDCQRCLEVGCDDYLAKPLSVESLSVQLSRYLDRESHSTVSCPQRNETALPDPLLEPEVPQENPSDRQREASLLFLDGVWRHVEQIQAALRHLDRNGLMHETHRLAGSAGLFGFAEISNVARIVEGLLRQGADFARVSQPSERLIRLCREVLDRTQP